MSWEAALASREAAAKELTDAGRPLSGAAGFWIDSRVGANGQGQTGVVPLRGLGFAFKACAFGLSAGHCWSTACPSPALDIWAAPHHVQPGCVVLSDIFGA